MSHISYCLNKKIHWYFFNFFISDDSSLFHCKMVFVIYFFSIFENILKDKLIKKRILDLIYKILFSIFIMYIVGYFESNPINAVSSGYGIFKIDVLSFLDPKPDGEKTWSLFLKDLNGTYIEGFTYLGLGNIFNIFGNNYFNNYQTAKKSSEVRFYNFKTFKFMFYNIFSLVFEFKYFNFRL